MDTRTAITEMLNYSYLRYPRKESWVEAYRMAIGALCKQMPVKPTDFEVNDLGGKTGMCPNCKGWVEQTTEEWDDWCPSCGQRLKWETE